MDNVENLYELSLMTIDELTPLLRGKVNAQKLYNFFHNNI